MAPSALCREAEKRIYDDMDACMRDDCERYACNNYCGEEVRGMAPIVIFMPDGNVHVCRASTCRLGELTNDGTHVCRISGQTLSPDSSKGDCPAERQPGSSSDVDLSAGCVLGGTWRMRKRSSSLSCAAFGVDAEEEEEELEAEDAGYGYGEGGGGGDGDGDVDGDGDGDGDGGGGGTAGTPAAATISPTISPTHTPMPTPTPTPMFFPTPERERGREFVPAPTGADAPDEDVVAPIIRDLEGNVAERAPSRPPTKRGAMCVGGGAASRRMAKVARRSGEGKESFKAMLIEVEQLILKLVNFQRRPTRELKDPRLRSERFIFTTAARRYAKECSEEAVSPRLDVLHNLSLLAARVAAEAREDAAAQAAAANSLLLKVKIREQLTRLIVSLWLASLCTSYMRGARRGSDSFRRAAAHAS